VDSLTKEEFHTLARTGELMLTTERDEEQIATHLIKDHGWINVDIHYEKDTEAGWLRLWID